ncbi:hypothetical protein KKG61_03005 [bacterium]|nr:hypothetical protein [bacterium]
MKKFLGFGLVLGMIGIGSLVEGADIYVGGNIPGSYTTIQAGVNACPTGGTVSVAAGTYTEAIHITNL